MEHDRVIVLENRRIEDAGLTQTDPSLDSRVGDDTFGKCFGQTVMVVCGHTDRITGSTPMQGFTTVPHLCYRTDINHFGLLIFGLR